MQKKTQKKIQQRTVRRVHRVKGNLNSKGLKPRICVFRSLKNMYAQIIDDSSQTTIASFSSLNLTTKDKKTDKKEVAKKVGIELGKIALSKSIDKVFFDRGRYLYHGRVSALAEGLRESGLQF
ncbi:50S ribosomal protein L18 [Candidatus Babeliales bacterium]|nr:50S ribosomal protein L18 [Candidatus Babeliales bacterium]